MLTRREFLTRLYQMIVAAGAAPLLSFEELLAADDPTTGKLTWQRPNLVWLQGASCSGCATSLFNIEQITVTELLTTFTRVVYHQDLSLATGSQVVELLDGMVASDEPYLFVLEGGIPVGMPHACVFAHRPLTEWVEKLAAKATLVIAAGTCAAAGGVAQMTGTVTGVATLEEFLNTRSITTPLINLPACPMKPEHLVYVLMHFIRRKTLPALDQRRRPSQFFAQTVHHRCSRYAAFQELDFARHIGEPGCLLELGCQGPITYNDCPVAGHNSNINICIRAGHPCIGCAGDLFPRAILYHHYDDPRVKDGLLQIASQPPPGHGG